MMRHYLSIRIVLVLFAAGGTLRAATQPHAGPAPEVNVTWTNEDLRRLDKVPELISVVGQPSTQTRQGTDVPKGHSTTEDPNWYAAQAASLNTRLEAEEADLRKSTKALDDTRELKSTAGGINLAEDDIGITPEATIEILQGRVRRTQRELGELEDLARQDDIPPGVLRGQ